MAKGKQTCKILKEIRKQIAADNDIELVISECNYQGDCIGTCPKCESEVRYLEHELEKRQRLGKAAVLAGVSLGTLFTASACDSTAKMPASNTNEPDNPVAQADTNRIEEPLMGIFPMYRAVYTFDAETYQSLLKDLFVFPKMYNLSVVSGSIEYEYAGKEKACESLEELAQAAKEFKAPCFPDGEDGLLEVLLIQSKVDVGNYNGDMEVAFTVDRMGDLSEVVVQKGIDKSLDASVVAVIEKMKWESGVYRLKDDAWSTPFDCRCMLRIHFPVRPVLLEGEPPIPIEEP